MQRELSVTFLLHGLKSLGDEPSKPIAWAESPFTNTQGEREGQCIFYVLFLHLLASRFGSGCLFLGEGSFWFHLDFHSLLWVVPYPQRTVLSLFVCLCSTAILCLWALK